MTRKVMSDIEAHARRLLLDEDATNYETSADSMKAYIMDEFRDLVTELELQGQGYGVKQATTTSVADQEYYKIPDDCIVIDYVAIENAAGEKREFEPINSEELERKVQQNLLPDTEAGYWAWEGNHIRIKPAVSETGRTIYMTYASVPVDPGAAGTEISLPYNFCGVLAVRAAITIKTVLEDDIRNLTRVHDEKWDRLIRLLSKRQRQKPLVMKSKWAEYRGHGSELKPTDPAITRRT